MLVSIIVPIFNRHSLAIRSLESVINQTYKNWELFLIDDKSDEQFLLPEKFKSTKQKIQVIRNEQNLGPGLSRQVGLNLSTGEYICFLDSDDLWLPEFLAEGISSLELNPDSCATYCQSQMSDGTLRHRNSLKDSVSDIFFGVVSGVRPWATCAIIWRRQYLAKWNAIRSNQDALFELETSINNEKIVFIPKILCVIDKSTGFNTDDIIGRNRGNVNRTLVLLRAVELVEWYRGQLRNQINREIWYALAVQLKKMVKQMELKLVIRLIFVLLSKIKWRIGF